tara:strand:+ start:16064 stop:16810 length:747 start_codon:yes stop_codon:yes gene_type:complete
MADIEKDYTFAIPDEMFVNDFSGSKTHTFTYKGPDKLTVTLPNDNNGFSSCYTQKLDGPVYPGEEITVIDLTKSSNAKLLPIADLLYGREYDLEATFTAKTLDDGTVYQEHNNFTIHDVYWKPRAELKDDGTFKNWILDGSGNPDLELIEKDTLSPKMRTYVAKADMFIEILDQFELADAEATLLANYKTAVNTYRSQVATPWKYPNQNPFDLAAPKIPMDLVTRHNAIKSAGLESMLGTDPNATPIE